MAVVFGVKTSSTNWTNWDTEDEEWDKNLCKSENQKIRKCVDFAKVLAKILI